MTRKTNPQIRWHLSDTGKKQIARISNEGLTQTAIAGVLHITRNTVCLALKKMALPTLKPLVHSTGKPLSVNFLKCSRSMAARQRCCSSGSKQLRIAVNYTLDATVLKGAGPQS